MTGSDNKKSEQTDATQPIPEIEAEVVSEDSAVHKSGTLFEDTPSASGDGPDAGSQTNEKKQNTKPGRPQRLLAMLAAVIFGTGLLAGGAWYFTSGNKGLSVTVPAETATSSQPTKESSKSAYNGHTETKDETTTLPSENDDPATFDAPFLPSNSQIEDQIILGLETKGSAPQSSESDAVEPFEPAESDTAKPIKSFDSASSEDTQSANGEVVQKDDDHDQQATVNLTNTITTDDIAESRTSEISIETPDLATRTDELEKLATIEAALLDETSRAASLETELVILRTQYETAVAEIQVASDRNAQAQQKIEELKAENSELRERAENSPVAAGAIALNEITRALTIGETFRGDLKSLKAAVPGAPEVELLAAYADGSAPLTTEIQRAFRDAIRNGLSTARKSEATNVWDRYSARAVNVINLRPSTPQPGPSPEAIISRAEFAVENGELQAAIDELSALPGPAREAMSDWIALAEKRIAIDAALASLNASIASEANG